jgi:hypothetical protein
MKKLIALFTVLSFTLAAIGQNDTTRYTMVNGYGFTYNRLKAKAAIVMPADTVQNKLPGSLVVLNDSLYVRTGVKWEKIGANAAVDTVIMSTRAWRQKGDDSVSALVALRVRISDTASMLLPYLRKSDTSAMLSPYFRKGDTVTLSNRINTKLNISDTAAMLAPYAKAVAGLPIGGTTGQILAKNSATNYDVAWIDNYTTDVRETVKATQSINKGQAVYVTGADGTNVLVSKASNTSDATSSKTLGLLYQNLTTNGQGFVIIQGRLSGLNTIGATAGDPVWLGTNGNLLYGTANKPVAPAHMVYIGVVTRVNSNNGEIFVNVQNGFELEELHNVLITDSINNQVIAYDSTTRLWKNKTIAQALGYTPANNATTVKYSDTASMLSPYLRDADTATLSNRINLKVNISDTASMLSPYARTSNVNAALALKVNISDTSSMLTPYLRKADTTAMLSPYARTSNVNAALATKLNISDTASMLSPYLKESDTLFLSNRINLKLNISDTAAMIAPYLRKSDTTAMLTPYLRKADTLGLSNRINLKVNISDTSSMLSPYIRAAGYGLTKSGQSLLVDTAAIATRARVQKAVDSLGSGKTNGSGTTNYIPKWTAANTLGNSQIFEEGTNIIIGSAQASGNKLMVDNVSNYRGIAIRTSTANARPTISLINSNTAQYMSYIQDLNGSLKFGYANFDFGGHVEKMSLSTEGRLLLNTTADAGYQFDVNGTMRSVNGANFATTSGNVGIGTTSPTAKLSVPGSERILGVLRTASTNRTTFYDSDFALNNDGGGAQGFIYASNVGGSFPFDNYGETIIQANPRTGYTNGISLVTGTTSPSIKMRINEGGNVGIGTNFPGAKLDVNGGDLNVNNYTAPNDANYSNLALRAGTDATLGSLYFLTQLRPSATGSNRRVDIFAGDNIGYRNITYPYGNIGIGTTSPVSKLHVNGNQIFENGNQLKWKNSTGGTDAAKIMLFTDNNIYVDNPDGATIFRNAGFAEAFRVFNNRRVGINTSSTDYGYALQVIGEIYSNSNLIVDGNYRSNQGATALTAATGLNYIGKGDNTRFSGFNFQGVAASDMFFGRTANSDDLVISTSNTGSPAERVRFTQSGNVGIGTNSPGSYKLNVAGNMFTNGQFILDGIAQTLYRNTANTIGFDIGLLGGTSVADAYLYQRANSAMIFGTNNTERMRIFNNGRVFIGASPGDNGYQLDVNGNTRVTGKIDVTANVSIGHNIARSGTSDIAAQIYSSNAWLLYGAESSTGGSIFTGSSSYAAVVGSGYDKPLQFATNSTVRATISASGELLIGTTSNTNNGEILQVSGRSYFSQEVTIGMVDVSTYAASLVVKGPVFFVNNQSSSLKGLYLDTTVLAISNTTNVSPITVTGSTFTGNNGGDILNLQSTWNTTANVNGIYMLITNTASGSSSNFLNLTDGSKSFRVTKNAEVITAAPTDGTARPWKLGEYVTTAPTATGYVQVEINGVKYKLLAATY